MPIPAQNGTFHKTVTSPSIQPFRHYLRFMASVSRAASAPAKNPFCSIRRILPPHAEPIIPPMASKLLDDFSFNYAACYSIQRKIFPTTI